MADRESDQQKNPPPKPKPVKVSKGVGGKVIKPTYPDTPNSTKGG